jgi:hypothetical protein
MGFLQQADGAIGSAFAPSATAGGAAAQSLGMGTLATGVNVASNIIGGIGGLEQGQFAAGVAGRNSGDALLAGQETEEASKLKYGGLEAKQTVAQAANGVQVGSGSVAATKASTELVSSMDAALIHFNASRQAFGETEQASLDRAAGKGALAKGVMGAGASFLSGANSLSDKWLSYKLSGAMSAGGN